MLKYKQFSKYMSLATYKKIGLEYDITDTMSSGIELFGHEVKSIKSGRCIIDGSKVILRGGEAFVVGMQVAVYQEKNTPKSYEVDRTRKLLLRKRDIVELYKITENKSISLLVKSLYLKGSLIKCDIAICKKLNKFDKRNKIKERDLDTRADA